MKIQQQQPLPVFSDGGDHFRCGSSSSSLKKREAKINVLTILLGQHTLHTLYRNAGYYIQESEVVAWI